MTDKIKHAMYRGSVWMLFQKSLDRVIGLVSTMIVARILTPEDYGLMAMAMSVYGFVQIMSAFGFDVILIQKDKIDRSDYDSAWTLRLIVYGVLSIILFFSASSLSLFLKDARLEEIIQLLSFAMFATGFVNIAVVDFRRDLKFNKEFYYLLSIKLSGFFIVVPFAFYFENYWALIFGIISTKVAQIIFSYVFRPYMPRLCFLKIKEFINFSKWLFFTNIMSYISQKSPNFLLGRIVGASSAGFYHMGFDISGYATTQLTSSINRAVFPGYSKLKKNIDELKKNYLEVIGLQTLLIFPLGMGLSASSPYFVNVLLGDNWGDLAPIMSLIVIGSSITAITSNTFYIYVVMGKPKITTYMSIIKITIFIPLLYVLIQKSGAIGAAYAFTTTTIFMLFIHFIFLKKIINIHFYAFIKAVIRPVISGVFMYFVLRMFVMFNELENSFLQLLSSVLIGAIVYIFTLLFLWYLSGKPNSAEKIVLGKLKYYISKFSR